MTPLTIILALPTVLLAVTAAVLMRQIRRRNAHLWLGSFIRESVREGLRPSRRKSDPVHVLLCIADHFEPAAGNVSADTAAARVAAWVEAYPRVLGEFRDSDGRPPRHTFFYPIDQYEPDQVDAIASLCGQGFGEVEIHLHHDQDTAENLDRTLRRFAGLFVDRHGLLGRWPDGRPAYGFVHGNWALDNSRPDHRWCGVDNELAVLERTGCYADFTLPSAPDASQTSKVNSLYYAVGAPGQRKSHDRGMDVGAGPPPDKSLMLIQGPLRLWWPRGRKSPRIENGCIQRGQPPSAERLDQWMRANIHVRGRPDWLFIKLHTHGASEPNRGVLLGESMREFHRELARRAATDPRFHFHYVTAREMYNLAKAAEAGHRGPIRNALDAVIWPPAPRPSELLLPAYS